MRFICSSLDWKCKIIIWHYYLIRTLTIQTKNKNTHAHIYIYIFQTIIHIKIFLYKTPLNFSHNNLTS